MIFLIARRLIPSFSGALCSRQPRGRNCGKFSRVSEFTAGYQEKGRGLCFPRGFLRAIHSINIRRRGGESRVARAGGEYRDFVATSNAVVILLSKLDRPRRFPHRRLFSRSFFSSLSARRKSILYPAKCNSLLSTRNIQPREGN